MNWVSLVLGIIEKGQDIYLKKLAVKYKEDLKDVEDKLWLEENKDFAVRDMALIDNLKRKESQLNKLFYEQIYKAVN
jgi:hypothetical protein